MIKTHTNTRLPVLALMLGAAFAAAPAFAATRAEAAEFAELNRQERAVCMKMEPGAVRDDCLLDAFGANLSRQRHTLDDAAPDYASNAIRRCEALKGDLRQGCLARMKGDGTATGTAREGGIYRELVTIEQVPSDAQMPPKVAAPNAPAPAVPAAPVAAPATSPVAPALTPTPMAKP